MEGRRTRGANRPSRKNVWKCEERRAGRNEDKKGSAKVQIGAVLLCKSAKVVHESIEYGVSSIGRGTISGGGWQPQVAGGGGR